MLLKASGLSQVNTCACTHRHTHLKITSSNWKEKKQKKPQKQCSTKNPLKQLNMCSQEADQIKWSPDKQSNTTCTSIHVPFPPADTLPITQSVFRNTPALRGRKELLHASHFLCWLQSHHSTTPPLLWSQTVLFILRKGISWCKQSWSSMNACQCLAETFYKHLHFSKPCSRCIASQN